MSKENSNQFGLPEAITRYRDLPVYEYVEPIAAAVDEEWLRRISVTYPHAYCLRHYWQRVIELFLKHVNDVGYAEAIAISCDRKLKKPKVESLDWFVNRIKDKESALRAVEKFIQGNTYQGFKLIGSFDIWLHEDGLVGGDNIVNEDLIDEEQIVEIR